MAYDFTSIDAAIAQHGAHMIHDAIMRDFSGMTLLRFGIEPKSMLTVTKTLWRCMDAMTPGQRATSDRNAAIAEKYLRSACKAEVAPRLHDGFFGRTAAP